MARRFHFVVERGENNGYVGTVLELEGCVSQGATLDELKKNITEAIQACLDVRPKKKELIKSVDVFLIEV